MDPNLTKLAISAAINHDWKQAISVNLKLLKLNPKDIDSLNRIARAYLETGQKAKAEFFYKKVLRIDKFDSIAHKGLEALKSSRVLRSPGPKLNPGPMPAFLEEPGVTKTVPLIRLGDPRVLNRLHPGDSVSIVPRDHCVAVLSINQEYLGRLPDDLASRLLPLLKDGNRYHAWLKSRDGFKVFIKEIYKSPHHLDIPSFPITEKLTYAAFTPPELVHEEKPDVSGVEEHDDYSPTADSLGEPDSRPALPPED